MSGSPRCYLIKETLVIFFLSSTDFYVFYKLHHNNKGNHFRRGKMTQHSPRSTDLCPLGAERTSKPEPRSYLSSRSAGHMAGI